MARLGLFCGEEESWPWLVVFDDRRWVSRLQRRCSRPGVCEVPACRRRRRAMGRYVVPLIGSALIWLRVPIAAASRAVPCHLDTMHGWSSGFKSQAVARRHGWAMGPREQQMLCTYMRSRWYRRADGRQPNVAPGFDCMRLC